MLIDIFFAHSLRILTMRGRVEFAGEMQSSTMGELPMPLTRAAIPAVQDSTRGIVRFVMKDGGRRVDVVVSNAALDDFDYASPDQCSYFHRFKEHRMQFEII